MRDGGYVFDGLHHQSLLLQSGDGTFPTAAGAVDLDIDLPHAEFHRFFGGFFGCHLTGKGRTFPASLEFAGSAGRPAKGVSFGVRNRNGRVVEGCFDVSNP